MIRLLLVSLLLSALVLPTQGQDLFGTYSSDHEFLRLEMDSFADFDIHDNSDPICTIDIRGRGKWQVIGDFIVINVQRKPYAHRLETTEDFKGRIRVLNLKDQEIAFAFCSFFDRNDSLLEQTSSDLDGWVRIGDSASDSVMVHYLGTAPFGFKLQQKKGHIVYLDNDDILREGQVIFKITSYKARSVRFKYVGYASKIHEIGFWQRLKFHILAFFTHSWLYPR